MGEMKKAAAEGDMLPGTLDMLILKALSRGEAHGYAIVQFIHGASRDVLKCTATFAPSRARPSAIDRPNPRPAPVTSAQRSASRGTRPPQECTKGLVELAASQNPLSSEVHDHQDHEDQGELRQSSEPVQRQETEVDAAILVVA